MPDNNKYHDIVQLVTENGNDIISDWENMIGEEGITFLKDLVKRVVHEEYVDHLLVPIRDLTLHYLVEQLDVIDKEEYTEEQWRLIASTAAEVIMGILQCRRWLKSNIDWKGEEFDI